MTDEKKKGTRTPRNCCKSDGILNLPKEVETNLSRIGGLKNLTDSLPEKKALDDIGLLHDALSDPIRLRILYALMKCDLCPCVLKEITKLSDSRLSYHLNVLEEAELVTQSPRHRFRIYSLTEEGKRRMEI